MKTEKKHCWLSLDAVGYIWEMMRVAGYTSFSHVIQEALEDHAYKNGKLIGRRVEKNT